MTNAEHIYAIKNILSKGPVSNTQSFSNELILHFLNVAAAKLLEEKANKYHNISEQSFSTICMDLEPSSYHTCCSGPVDKCFAKSTIELPKVINTRHGLALKVTDLAGEVIPMGSPTIYILQKYSALPKRVMWFLLDNRVYITSSSLEKIMVTGLFASSTNEGCTDENSIECKTYLDSEFPIDSDLVDSMYKITLEYLLRQPMKDTTNNAQEDTQTSQFTR